MRRIKKKIIAFALAGVTVLGIIPCNISTYKALEDDTAVEDVAVIEESTEELTEATTEEVTEAIVSTEEVVEVTTTEEVTTEVEATEVTELDTSLNDEDFFNTYGMTKEEYLALKETATTEEALSTEEVISEETTEETTEEKIEYPYNPTEVVIVAGSDSVFREEDLPNILSNYEGLYILEYDSVEEATECVEYYSQICDYACINKETISIATDEQLPTENTEATVDETPVEEVTEATTEAQVEGTEQPNPEATTEAPAEEQPEEERFGTGDTSLDKLNEVVNDGISGYGKIALIDTGVNGAVSGAVSFVGDSTADDNGHGTLMYNYIKEEYPNANIISIKVLGANGMGQPVDVCAGIEYAIAHDVSIINLSMSAFANADNAIVEQKINEAISKGIIVVGAVGNKGMDAKYFVPAKISGAVIVGAIDKDGNPLPSSNYGATLDYLTYAGSSSEASARVSGLIARYGIDGLLDTGKVFGFSDETIEITEDNYSEIEFMDWSKIVWGLPAEYNGNFNINTLQEKDGALFPGYIRVEARMGKASGGMLGNWNAPQFDSHYNDDDPDEGGNAWQRSQTWYRGTNLNMTLVECVPDALYTGNDLEYTGFFGFCTQGGNSNTPPQGATIDALLYFIPSQSTANMGYYAAGGIYHTGGGTYQHVGMEIKAIRSSIGTGITVHKSATGNFLPSPNEIQYTLYSTNGDTPWLIFTIDDWGYTKNIELVSGASNTLNGYTYEGTESYPVDDTHNDVYAILSSSGGIVENDFYLKETRTNNNYQLDPDPHYVGRYSGGRNVIELKDDYTPPKGAIQILKVDGNGNPVGGASYTLSQNGVEIMTKVTSSQTTNLGLCTFDDLDAGTYTIKEKTAPAGYELDNTTYTVTINLDNAVGTRDESYSYVFDSSVYKSNMGSYEQGIISQGWGGDNKYSFFNHWFLYGCNEGRKSSLTFDQTSYKNRHGDLSSMSLFDCAVHYQTNGARENRKTLSDTQYAELGAKSITGNNTGLVIVKSVDPRPLPLVVKKVTSSTCTELVANNPNYSLAGAEFKIYKDGNCTQPLTNNAYDFVTDASGNTTAFDLSPYVTASQNSITVYIREEKASKGYNRNITPARVVVTKGTHTSTNPATVTIEEVAKGDPADIVVYKESTYKQRKVEGAIFEVKFYACESQNEISNTTYRRHWYLRTGENGRAHLDDNWVTSFNESSSDAFYYAPDGNPVFPIGFITVEEVYAPTGYILDSTIHTYPTTGRNPEDLTTEVENRLIQERTVNNQPWKQPVEVIKLGSDERASVISPLPNAGFMFWNLEDIQKDENGEYIFDESTADVVTATGEKEIFTDANGKFKTQPLAYGSYIVKETTTPEGYLPAQEFTVSVTENKPDDAQTHYIRDDVIYYYLRITKYDNLTGKVILNNKSSYKIKDNSTGKFISFRTYNNSTFVLVDEFSTNDEGLLILPEPLKFGEYTIYETKGPDGYNITNPEGIPFTIDSNTAHETYEVAGDTQVMGIVDVTVKDNPVYGNINIIKTGDSRFYNEEKDEFEIENLPLEGIEFGIYANEDIISKDGWNTVLFHKGDLVDTIITDREGKASISDLMLGKYLIKELNTPDDYIPMEDKEVELKMSNAKTVDDITFVEEDIEVVNKPYYPKVKTTALDSETDEHTGGVLDEEVTVVDKVDCSDLVIGRTYTVKGKLYDTKTKDVFLDNSGNEITAEKTFTAEAKSQTVDLTFTYKRKDLAGETIVVFETLYYDEKVVATHTDINDEDQQVHYPDVKTTALDSKTNTHTGIVDEKVTVVDKVACTNLVVGKEYTIKGKLYNTETGGAILEGGKEVTAEKKFTAEEKNPVIDLEFTLNSKTLQGETIVVFEDLYVKNIKVATHSDLTDKDQQVSYPKVGTKASDKDTESRGGVVGSIATIIDTVDCKNLVVGETYTVKGKLYNTETGEVFLDNGNEVVSEKTFKADKKDMSVEIVFIFNSTALEGQTTTVFEDLYSNGIKVASHSDLSDKDQQIDYPRVKTTAKDKATGTHTGTYAEKVTVIDTVECTNLIVGKEYTVKGKLYNTETGEVFLDNGNEVVSEKTFKADKKDMTVDLEFTFNSTSLIGETVVVFEDLYHKNIKVDTHNRLDDKDQQVHYPKIGTTAKNAVDGGKTSAPNKSVKLNDTVDVTNVEAGDKFVLKGVIYDKATGEKVLINGEEVWATSTFQAPDKNFKTDVVFTFDATTLAGKSIVVFEYLYLVKEDGTEVFITSHEDINDAGQTITFTTEPKTGDRGFADVLVIFILSLIGIVALYLVKRKALR